MIRDAVLHLEGEQPLLGDLYRLPEPTDAGLLTTNVRTLDGRRPVFIDHTGSVFFFPFRIMRFVEIPGVSGDAPAVVGDASAPATADGNGTEASAAAIEPSDGREAELELDEDFLRRVKEI